MHHFQEEILKMDINYILLDFKSHLLHNVSVIWGLACHWLRIERREQRVGILSLKSLLGCCRPQGGHRSFWLIKRGFDQQVRCRQVTLYRSLTEFCCEKVSFLTDKSKKKHMWSQFVDGWDTVCVCLLTLTSRCGFILKRLDELNHKNLIFLATCLTSLLNTDGCSVN